MKIETIKKLAKLPNNTPILLERVRIIIESEDITSVFSKIIKNHWRPDYSCPKCKGELVIVPIELGKMIIDGIKCKGCGELGQHCGTWKKTCSCEGRDTTNKIGEQRDYAEQSIEEAIEEAKAYMAQLELSNGIPTITVEKDIISSEATTNPKGNIEL